MSEAAAPAQSPLRQIVQPFLDLARAPRVLWGMNLSYLVEGFTHFGGVTYLAMYFNLYGGLGDKEAGWMVGALTSGITLAMFFFGGMADRWGARRAIFFSLALMVLGRLLLFLAPALGLAAGGLATPFTGVAFAGILLLVLGFGIYQPAVFAGVCRATTPETSAMAFAMLYAVNNLGGWLPTFMSPFRTRYGIDACFAFFAGATLLGFVALALLLGRTKLDQSPETPKTAEPENKTLSPVAENGLLAWLKRHPLADARFAFFIFSLIPVQTLFAYNWLVLPQYVSRAFAGTWLGAHFEAATALNSLLIFILCPLVAALTARKKTYPMMIAGTAVMAAPAFLLAFGPRVPSLAIYVLVLSIGEAIWQPRFLQHAAEIAPEGRTGAYMGVAYFPWFLTKMLVPMYSGLALSRWCPRSGALSTGTMWLFFAGIATLTPILLILARGWAGRGMKDPAGAAAN